MLFRYSSFIVSNSDNQISISRSLNEDGIIMFLGSGKSTSLID